MRYYYLAPEENLGSIFTGGVKADANGEIILVVLKDDFLMDKFIFDAYAYEVLGLDVYCLFQVLGIGGELSESNIDHTFSGTFKVLKQEHIEKKYVVPYKSDTSYEGMGLEEGVFPVENKEKLTPAYKQKILEYLEALDG